LNRVGVVGTRLKAGRCPWEKWSQSNMLARARICVEATPAKGKSDEKGDSRPLPAGTRQIYARRARTTIVHPHPMPAHPLSRPSISFLLTRSEFCLTLSSDSALRQTPLPRLAVPAIPARTGLSPPRCMTCLAHTRKRESPRNRALPSRRQWHQWCRQDTSSRAARLCLRRQSWPLSYLPLLSPEYPL